MADLHLTTRVNGLDRHLRRIEFRTLDRKVKRKILRGASRAATNPVKTELRRGVRANLTRFGYLAKAITSKVKSYARGFLLILVGARDRKLPNGENPGKYFHLADGASAQGVRDRAVRRTEKKVSLAFAKRFEKLLRKEIT